MIGATISAVQETASEAITKLIYTYAERIDAGDFAGVAEVFAARHPDLRGIRRRGGGARRH